MAAADCVAPGAGCGTLPPVSVHAHHGDQGLVAAVLARTPGAQARLDAHLDVAIERCLARLLARWPEAAADRADLRQGLALHLVRDDCRVLRSYRGEARLTTWVHAVATRYFHQEIQRLVRAQRAPAGEPAAPTPAPINPDSVMGVSRTRSRPNSWTNPLVTPNTPPQASRWSGSSL